MIPISALVAGFIVSLVVAFIGGVITGATIQDLLTKSKVLVDRLKIEQPAKYEKALSLFKNKGGRNDQFN